MQLFVVTARNGEFGLDGRMRLVAHDLDVFRLEFFERREVVSKFDCRERFWFTGELLFYVGAMVLVHVIVAECVDEFSRFASEDFGDDAGEECIRGDVERDTEEYVCASLVELEAYPAVLDIELVHVVANGKARAFARTRHRIHVLGVPRGDERVVRIGVFAQLFYRPTELVYLSAVTRFPAPPMFAVDMRK